MAQRKKPLITPRQGGRAGQGVIQLERQQRTGQWSRAETQSVTNAFIVFLGSGQKASKTLLNFFVYFLRCYLGQQSNFIDKQSGFEPQ